jgi:hypothetical protein
MSTSILAGDLSEGDQSMDRFRGFGALDLPALVELEPGVAEPGPGWWAGTLPGVMAGKRPAPKPTSPIALR